MKHLVSNLIFLTVYLDDNRNIMVTYNYSNVLFKYALPLIFSDFKHGIRLTTNIDGKVLITFNARNEHDRSKFVEDLKEAILEVTY